MLTIDKKQVWCKFFVITMIHFVLLFVERPYRVSKIPSTISYSPISAEIAQNSLLPVTLNFLFLPNFFLRVY